jgi:hypothetical protein
MTVLNSSDFDAQTMRIPNIVLNASTTLILSLINNYKLAEKSQTFRSKSIKYMHLCNQIEDSLTNDLNNINIDKIRNFINEYDAIGETLEFGYPTRIKNSVRKRFLNKKTLPNSLNMVGTFVNVTPPSTPTINNNPEYTV